jgi:hypothetical protein
MDSFAKSDGNTMNAKNKFVALILFSMCVNASAFSAELKHIKLDVPMFYSKAINVCKHDVMVTGKNDGHVTIISGENSCKPTNINIENVEGQGTIQIINTGGVGIYVSGVNQRELLIEGEDLSIINFNKDPNKIKQIKVVLSGQKNGSIYVGDDSSADNFQIALGGSIDGININSEEIRHVSIVGGKNIGDRKSRVGVLDLRHAYNVKNDSVDGHLSGGVYVNGLSVSHFKANFQGKSHDGLGSDQGIMIHNVDIGSEGYEVYVLGQYQFFEVRNILFIGRSKSDFVLHTTDKSVVGRLVVSDIFESEILHLEPLGDVDHLALRNLRSDQIKLSIPNNKLIEYKFIDVSKLETKWWLQSPTNVLITIANNNAASIAKDRIELYTLIARKGAYVDENTPYISPRLEALEGRYLEELDQRSIDGKILGYMLWFVTGYGSNLFPPAMFLLATIVIFGAVYWILLYRTDKKQSIFKVMLSSLLFTLSMGFPSEIKIKTRFSIDESKSSLSNIDNILIMLPHFQGGLAAVQATLITIYFGQTIISPL